MKNAYDAAIVGAGPNSLTAANVLAAAGLSVIVLEVHDRVGGSCRTEALTLPGFAHDVCSATHPMAVVSPAFRGFQLDRFGLQWASGPALLAHPFDHGPAALLERSMTNTAASLGEDGRAWLNMFAPFVERHEPVP